MILDALVRLHTQGGRRFQVSRVDLLKAVNLPEATVDDRLRTLIKEKRVLRVGRALYAPKPWPGQEPRRAEQPGKTQMTCLADGVVVEKWFSLGDKQAAAALLEFLRGVPAARMGRLVAKR